MRERIEVWREMGASDSIVKILRDGYRLPLNSMPERRTFKNHGSCSEHADFVAREVKTLVAQGCATEMYPEEAWVCSPLGVHDNGRKLRLILDMRYVNTHLARLKFKMEDIRTAAQIYKKGDYLITFDLKSGYHHVSIHKDHWKLLAFQWNGKVYAFTVLPFGCSASPWCFTKVTRVLVRYWRSQGVRCMMYMDDGSAGDQPEEQARSVSQKVRADLDRAGFIVNEPKSSFEPKQEVQQLGFTLDTCLNLIKASERRVQATRAAVAHAVQKGTVSARELAKVAGHIISMSVVLGPVCRLRTRAMYAAIETRHNWSSRIGVCDEVAMELQFWGANFEELHGRPLWSESPRGVEICTDASETGWGGHACGEVASGEWSPLQARKSSTWRELRAACNTLEALGECFRGESCILKLDNQAAVHILQKGSRREELQQEALTAYALCREKAISLSAQWLPREENTLADLYSRVVDENDWMLSREWFLHLDERFGPHTVDCFATSRNNQLPRFFAKLWCPGCEGADAFTRPWEGENVWLVPPVHLILRTIRMMQYSECHGTLVAPLWKSAVWWPIVHPQGGWAPWVADVLELPSQAGLFVSGSCEWNLFSAEPPPCRVIALRLCLARNCQEASSKPKPI